MSVLLASNLNKSYGDKTVVRNVTVKIDRGEIVGVLGPNGAGKTTCFYMIAGIIEPDGGSVYIGGKDITKMPMYKRAKMGIGYLPQETSIFRGLTVEENIMAVLEFIEPSEYQRKLTLDQIMDMFSIKHLRRVLATSLSGGERRRLEIARAVAISPDYILLDEPFAGVDPISVSDIRAVIKMLAQNGIGVLITDHSVRETLDIVDRAYIIYDGSVIMNGTPEEIKNNPTVRKVYLGDYVV